MVPFIAAETTHLPWERPVIEMEKEPELYIIPAKAGATAIYNTSQSWS